MNEQPLLCLGHSCASLEEEDCHVSSELPTRVETEPSNRYRGQAFDFLGTGD